MTNRGRILSVEDLPKWRGILERTFRDSEFEIDTVGSLEEAREKLATNVYHLLILDIRMEDSDETNRRGMDFLGELDGQGLIKTAAYYVVMLSAYGTTQDTLDAFGRYGVVDFFVKDDFDNQQFLNAVREIFDTKIRVNPSLAIQWQDIPDTAEAIVGLKVNNSRVQRGTDTQQSLVPHTEDLFGRLFPNATSVLARPLTGGHSGSRVFRVFPEYDHGGGEAVVVKIGELFDTQTEAEAFESYIKPFLGARRTNIEAVRYTPRLGGIVYSFLGVAGESLEDFEAFYQRASLQAIKDVTDNLFRETCGKWYANKSKLKNHDLAEDYRTLLGFTPEKLSTALARIKSIQGKDDLYFSNLEGNPSYTNALEIATSKPVWRQTNLSITHGDLNQHNIVIDDSNKTWLIDFYNTQDEHHVWRDFAKLDTVVRLELLAETDASLQERLDLEEQLCRTSQFGQLRNLEATFITDNVALDKTIKVIAHLRRLAGSIGGRGPNDDFSEYNIALFFNAVNTIRHYDLSKVQREHALLSACLLAEHLRL